MSFYDHLLTCPECQWAHYQPLLRTTRLCAEGRRLKEEPTEEPTGQRELRRWVIHDPEDDEDVGSVFACCEAHAQDITLTLRAKLGECQDDDGVDETNVCDVCGWPEE